MGIDPSHAGTWYFVHPDRPDAKRKRSAHGPGRNPPKLHEYSAEYTLVVERFYY